MTRCASMEEQEDSTSCRVEAIKYLVNNYSSSYKELDNIDLVGIIINLLEGGIKGWNQLSIEELINELETIHQFKYGDDNEFMDVGDSLSKHINSLTNLIIKEEVLGVKRCKV